MQRLGQVARARLHLFEQARVADGDHSLIGEGLQHGDLLVAERLSLGAANDNGAEALALPHERHGQNGAMAHAPGEILAVRKLPAFRRQIVHMNRLAVDDRTPPDPTSAERPRFEAEGNGAAMRAEAHRVAVLENDGRVVGVADLAGAVDDRLQGRATSVGEAAITLRILPLTVW